MAFKLGDIIIDRVQMGLAETVDQSEMLYTLTQLADTTINITAEAKDALAADGSLIKRFYQGKAGELNSNNAMLNLNVIGHVSGSGMEVASLEEVIPMPKIIKVKAGTTVTLSNYVEGSVLCNAYYPNGNMGAAYKLGTAASATEFGLTSEGVFTPPTDEGETMYVVKYTRKVSDGAVIRNRADKFPSTVRLTLKALCVDPCSPDVLRACYIVIPSFQVSPETEINLTTDGQLPYNGTLQVAYCSDKKVLYEIYIATEDEEEDEE